MQYISIPADEYARHVRNETVLEILNLYYSSTEYPNPDFIKKANDYCTSYMPFTVPSEVQEHKPLAFKDMGIGPKYEPESDTERNDHVFY